MLQIAALLEDLVRQTGPLMLVCQVRPIPSDDSSLLVGVDWIQDEPIEVALSHPRLCPQDAALVAQMVNLRNGYDEAIQLWVDKRFARLMAKT